MAKILIASDFYDTNIGGVEIFIKNLEKILQHGGYEVKKLLTSSKEPIASDKIVLTYKKAINISSKVHFLQRSFRKYFAVKEIKNKIKDFDPDIVIACKINTLYLFDDVLRNNKKTILIGSLHGIYNITHIKNEKNFLVRVDALCVLSEEQKKIYFQFCKNIHIAPNPIQLVQKSIKKQNLITCVSRVDSDKRVDVFVKAVSLLQDKLQDFDFVVAGGGALLKNTQQLANKLNARIKFLGHISQDEVFNLYAKAKINVLSSVAEGFPYALVEPMQYNCARISTRYKGGSLDILIDDEIDGLICELDENDLAKKMLFLAQNDEKRIEITQKAKEKFDNFAKNANDFYINLIKDLQDERS